MHFAGPLVKPSPGRGPKRAWGAAGRAPGRAPRGPRGDQTAGLAPPARRAGDPRPTGRILIGIPDGVRDANEGMFAGSRPCGQPATAFHISHPPNTEARAKRAPAPPQKFLARHFTTEVYALCPNVENRACKRESPGIPASSLASWRRMRRMPMRMREFLDSHLCGQPATAPDVPDRSGLDRGCFGRPPASAGAAPRAHPPAPPASAGSWFAWG